MKEKWKQLSVVVGIATFAALVMVAAASAEEKSSEGGNDLLRVVAPKFTRHDQQNQLNQESRPMKEKVESLGKEREKVYQKKKKKRNERKNLKARQKKIPPYIRRVASMVASRPLQPQPLRKKRIKKTTCGKSYKVRRNSKYRLRISKNIPCSVIFRAVKGASLRLSCKRIIVGNCEDSEFIISDGVKPMHRYCGPSGSSNSKVKLAKTAELFLTYKQWENVPAGTPPPDVNCVLKGAKGTGYVAKGKQFCPYSCGKATASAEAEKLVIRERPEVVTTTARWSTTKSSSTSDNSIPATESLNGSPTTSSTSPDSLSSVPDSLTSTTSTSLFRNSSAVIDVGTNATTAPVSLGRKWRDSIRVQGGKPADIGEWPFIVSLLVVVGGAILPCSGTILTSTVILTAAHCVYDVKKKRDRIKVIAYEYNMRIKDETPRQTTLVKRIILHPQYEYKTQTADIALLKLRDALVFGEGVGPVCIAPAGNYVGDQVVILGWGSLKYLGKDPEVLQEATQLVMDINECARNYSSLPTGQEDYPVTRDHLCTASPGIDSCEGDSGGPVLIQIGTSWYQLGIISFGYKCAVPGFPGVNTLLPAFTDWIFSTINEDSCN